jgi:hypothetical protein
MYAKNNDLTVGAVETQQILEVANVLGIDNSLSHAITLKKSNNNMAGGTDLQASSAITDL